MSVKSIRRKFLVAMLVISVFCLSIIPASAAGNVSTEAAVNTAAANYRIPAGSFIQDYMTASWSDDRWQQELTALKEAGMNYLIFSPSVSKDGDYVRAIYPTKIPELEGGYTGTDCIDACLRNCEQAGVKVFIALNQDPGKFWQYGWKISATQPDVWTQYWKDNAVLSNKVADELYSMYKSKYKNAFYGWYWVHEFWNYTICTYAYENKDPNEEKYKDGVASDPKVYTDILAKEALNPVLDHLTQIDSSMPMLFSSFYNPTLCEPESMTRLWTDVFGITNFRPGDIWAPMDGMGGGLMSLDILDKWTAAAKKATEANKNLHFWINNEEQVVYADWNTGKVTQTPDDEVALIDRVVKQIEITSKYAEQNVFFAWDHYYSPYNTLPGFNDTYLQYVKNGSIEKNAPSAVDTNAITVKKSGSQYRVSWKEPKDDVGIAVYNIYKDGLLVTHMHPNRLESSGKKPVLKTTFTLPEGTYQIEALDFAGNASPKVEFAVNDTEVTRTHTTATETTDSTTVTTDTATTSAPILTTAAPNTTAAPSNTTASGTKGTTTKGGDGNPKTGSGLPTAALLLLVVSAGVGISLKSSKKS